MELTKKDINVSKLKYDPFDPKTVKVLQEYDEFKQDFGVDKQKLFAYIILMYDMGSDLRHKIEWLNPRKKQAAELANFPKADRGNTFEPGYENVIIGGNKKANSAISRYIRLFANPKYTLLIYYQTILASEFDNLNDRSAKSSDYNKILGNIKACDAGIENCTSALFGGDEEISSIKLALYEDAERENLGLRPEDVALDLSILDDIIANSNPYGKGYKPRELKFKGDR